MGKRQLLKQVLYFIPLLVFGVIFTLFFPEQPGEEELDHGIFDLERTSAQGIVNINNGVEYYDGVHISPEEDFSLYNSEISSIKTSPKDEGIGTYRIVLDGKDLYHYGLLIDEHFYSCRIYANGRIIALHNPHSDFKRPNKGTGIYPLYTEGNRIEIIMQVEFSTNRATNTVAIGPFISLKRHFFSSIITFGIIMGGLIFVAFISLAVYFTRLKETAYLSLFILTLIMFIKEVLRDGWYVTLPNIFFMLPSRPMSAFFGALLAIGTAVLAITIFRPRRWVFISFLITSSSLMFFSLLYIITEIDIFRLIVAAHLIFSFSVTATHIVLCLKDRREGSLLFSLGILGFLVTGVLDILSYRGIVDYSFLLYLGFFVNAFFQFFVLSSKYSAAYKEKDELHRRKDQLYAAISHDIKTPLYGIIGGCEQILDGFYGEHLRDFRPRLKRIGSTAVDLSTMINEVHDLIIDNRIELDSNHLNLKEICLESVASIKDIPENNSLEYHVNIDENLYVYADRAKLKRILYNVVGNSSKYTLPKGRGCITLSAKSLPEGMIGVSVSDTGVGIPRNRWIDVFNPFTRAYHKGRREGSGLGLSICKLFVEAHKGDIYIKSSSEEGTVLFFSIPEGRAVDCSGPGDEGDGMFPALIGKKMLVVDDLYVIRSIVKLQLSSCGMEIDTVESGLEALTRIREKKYDIVLLDMTLPDMDGVKVCRDIRKDFSKKNLPVFFFSGNARNMPEEQAALANGFIDKPVSRDDLISVLNSVFKK